MQPPQQGVSKDSTNIAVIMEIGMLFFGFIPPLVVYLVKKEDPFLLEQSKESLNAGISIILAFVIANLIDFTRIGFIVGVPLLLAIYVYALIVCIKGAIENSNSRIYQFPFILRLIH